MSLSLTAISALGASAVAPIRGSETRAEPDAAQNGVVEPSAASLRTGVGTSAPSAIPLTNAPPLTPALMSELISLQAQVERDLPGLFDRDAVRRARNGYIRRRNLLRAA